VDEFTQVVCVRLWANDYAIIRKFEERAVFTTYLTTVIIRLFHQWRVEQWGKWRPSAEAKRIGGKAILLERLLTRDGYTFAEAVSSLTMRSDAAFTVAELEQLYVRLPLRTPRTTFVSDELTGELGVEGDAEDRAGKADREKTGRKAGAVLDAVLQTLPSEDRVILQMRFWDAMKVPEIALLLRLNQKKLYKRLDKLFITLRRALENAGISRAEVEELLKRGDQDIELGILGKPENPPFRPSNSPDGEGEPQ
jgi:RNA polymerase sigma factor for flagellar operon FliA